MWRSGRYGLPFFRSPAPRTSGFRARNRTKGESMSPRPNQRFGLSSLVCLTSLLAAGMALGDDARLFELSWQAPAGCPPAEEVERDITRLVGSGAHERPTVRAVVDVAGNDDEGWRVHLRME